MPGRSTFFATQAERRKLKKYFDKERLRFFQFEQALADIQKGKRKKEEDIPLEVRTFAFLTKYSLVHDWGAFQNLPTDVTEDLIRIITLAYENKEAVNSVDTGILSALNKYFSAVKS